MSEADGWRYAHRDLQEPRMLDGIPILRPCVELTTGTTSRRYLGVVDSGSPICVADPALVAGAGVDLETTEPVIEVPLGMGAAFRQVPVFEVRLSLMPPDDIDAAPVPWSLLVAARRSWRFPFAILLGMQGFFDRFPTTIDGTATNVQL